MCTGVARVGAPRRLAHALVIAATIALTGCGLFGDDDSPTSPSPTPSAPTPASPIRYTALGASDAVGVGASVMCVPFAECADGTGYVPHLARRLRTSREVRLTNLGIPAAVLSPAIHQIARDAGRDIPANFVDREMPFVPMDATLVTVFGGANDTNALADAMSRGAGGSSVTEMRAYIETQVRAFGADYGRLISGIRGRAPGAFIIVINVPNMAGLPYAVNRPQTARQVLQAISVGFSREANRQAGSGVVVLDLMCDPQSYDGSRFSSDGFHPNDAGYAYLSDRLLPLVNGGTPSVPASCPQMTLVPTL